MARVRIGAFPVTGRWELRVACELASRVVYLRYSRFICGTCDFSAFLKIYLLFSKFICVAEILSAVRQYPAPFKNGNPFNCLLFAGEKRKCPFTCSKAPFVFSHKKSAASAALPSSYILFSISAQAASLPRPVSDEKTINGSFLSISSVWRTTFLCFSHLPFGILSAFVAMMMHGIS